MIETRWTVEWSRPGETDIQTCTGLTIRQVFRCTQQVIKNCGAITIWRIMAEVQTGKTQ